MDTMDQAGFSVADLQDDGTVEMSADVLLMMSILMTQLLSPYTFVPPPVLEVAVAHPVTAKLKSKAAPKHLQPSRNPK
jgi:hypothetical protein|eukprot:CAMPEP_0174315092 /NCGR_PEP_ID=MMETSP0810-20121108/6061_1 /TAXON_ID=73025 ORGANISM="Eutreptiella gymnastica-like, Strain CCMP1594" /NCGR_SAMPLE_ID=MMETSP0810 /ASSEMBLY_ACC=CAM_ASM_000659 /LENGTH=77 /DNA_ID=CAMNT_0015424373 /DNA_START=515 /DNA_END=748 /DNA_ORIENTATION=-